MDFIVKLLKLEDLANKVPYNSILVIVDQLTKMAKFVPFKKTIDTEQLAAIIDREVFSKHRLSKEIITN